MITKSLLIEASQKINLIKFIDNFLEQKIAKENDIEKYNILLEVYSEGWGDTISNWMTKAGDFFGKIKSNVGKSNDSFWQAYNKHSYNPELNIAQKAYEMLKKANLLSDPTLKDSLETLIYNLNTKTNPPKNKEKQMELF